MLVTSGEGNLYKEIITQVNNQGVGSGYDLPVINLYLKVNIDVCKYLLVIQFF